MPGLLSLAMSEGHRRALNDLFRRGSLFEVATIRHLILVTILLAQISSLPTATLSLQSEQDPLEDAHVSGSPGEPHPILVFASDRPTSEVRSLLSQADVMADLKELKAGIALSVSDLSAERAHIVAQLNTAGIPVTAWLALPEKQGHYLNADNEPDAAARFLEFEHWSAEYELHWAAIGLDIEPSTQEFSALRSNKLRLAAILVRRYFELNRVRRAKQSYLALISEIHNHGYQVETYQFPFIADERKMRSTLLERLAGIVDVRSDREVLMLYSSFNPKLDSALIWVYGAEAQAIAVGSTAGSDSDRSFVPLTWEEFSRDVIVAHHFSNVIGVYSLEGSIRQGFLPRLVTLDWDREVIIPGESVERAARFRTRVQWAIWIGSHLPSFAVMMLIVIGASIAWWRRSRRLGTRQSGNA